MQSFNTLADALDAQIEAPVEIGFIDGASDERAISYRLLARSAERMLAVLQSHGASAGDPVILFTADNLRFLQFFWASIYGALVPVPIAAGTSEAHLDKLVTVWRHMGEPRVVIQPALLERVREHLSRSGDAEAGRRLAERALSDEPPTVETPAVRPELAPEDTAFIQFSSGSTGEPKGVVLSHANVLANIEAITAGSRFAPDEVALSWMPLTHDMGLIGFHLTLVCHGFEHFLMAPDLFARRPLLWLEKAAETRASLLCAPNFGYRHTLRAIAARGLPDVDLSAVRLIYNGAEPIAPLLAREFLDTLAPLGVPSQAMFPVYGMAEASLAVTFPAAGEGMRTLGVTRGELGIGDTARLNTSDQAIELVCLGTPVQGCELRIADAKGEALGQDRVGRVLIRGANVTAGYHHNPAANAAAWTGDGWLDTGDLGFVHDGDLLITGRAKEVIFVNGQNHYPQDLEALLADIDGGEPNKLAAAGVRSPGADADELLLFVVFRGHNEDFLPVARGLAAALNRRAGLVVDRVLPIARMPKTTSGKLQRSSLARQYAAGEFDAVAAALDRLMSAGEDRADESQADEPADVATQLKAICDEVVPERNIGFDDDLFESGLSSLELAQIHEGIESRWPDRLDVTDLFDYPTINALAECLQEQTTAA